MTLTITDTRITSDVVGASAEFRPAAAADGIGAWVVTGLPDLGGRLLTRDQVISVLTAAEAGKP